MAKARQRGMAVISALLIAAVVAVIAAGMIERQGLFTQQVENRQLALQGQWALEGGLQGGRALLREQRQRDPLVRNGPPWSQPQPLAGGLEGRLEDEQGKFNLRNLVIDGQVNDSAVAAFRRLCGLIGIEERLATAIVERVVGSYPQRPPQVAQQMPQSLDSGRLTSPASATTAQPAKYPMLRDLAPLAMLKGMRSESFQRLQRVVTVLPALTWVNGNTASAEVLAAQVPGLSLQQATTLVAERDSGRWFVNRGDFVNRLRMPQLLDSTVQIGIDSEWFRWHGQARQGQRVLRMEALLRQHQGQLPDVIWTRVGA